MRKLNTHDVFNALRIATNTKVKEQLIDAYNKLNDTNADEVGLELIGNIIGGASQVEGEIYNFLSGPLEIEADKLEQMEFMEFINTLKEFIAFIDPKEWQDFFTSLLRMVKVK